MNSCYGLFFWKWSLKCLLWNLCRAWVDFLCVFKFCRNCDFKSQTLHENGARGKTIQRKYQFNYTFILVTFTVLKYTYAHMCKANERKALTLPTYNISSKKSRQQICHVDEQASTYTHSQWLTVTLMTFGKNFSWPFKRNVTLYSKPSNRLNKVSHQVKQFANGVILSVFI